MNETGKYLIIIGIILIVIGLVVLFAGDKFSWFGNLPGDIKSESKNLRIYFPFTSMIIVSIVLSVLVYLIKKIL